MHENHDSSTGAASAAPAGRRAHLRAIVPAVLAGGLIGVMATPALSPSTAPWAPSVAAQPGSGPTPRSTPAGFADLVDTVKPAVIGVQAKIDDDDDDAKGANGARMPRRDLRPDRQLTAQGSGFFISADGYAVTNNHVVEGNGAIRIETDDKKSYDAKLVGTDPTTDLALLKVDGRDDFPHVALADATPRVGDWILAIGNPFGLGGTVTAGIVSARERDIGADSNDRLIQIDAPINKGDSGGPTFDLAGRVIGVNTMIFSPSGGSIGIAFAIPADTVRTIIPQLRSTGTVTRGWLGVVAQPVTVEIADGLGLKEARGALVIEPQADSPAAKAGVASGDVIAAVNDAPIADARDLSKRIANAAPGTAVTLRVLHQGERSTVEEKNVSVTLGRLPAKTDTSAPGNRAPPRNRFGAAPNAGGDDGSATQHPADLGLQLAPAGSEQRGVVITGVDPSGLAADRGFEPGDIILDVGGKSVATPDEVKNGLSDARRGGRHTVLLRLKSGHATRFVAVPMG